MQSIKSDDNNVKKLPIHNIWDADSLTIKCNLNWLETLSSTGVSFRISRCTKNEQTNETKQNKKKNRAIHIIAPVVIF